MSLTSVEKALALLRAIDESSHKALGVSELARRTNLSKSTAFRLLAVLEANGALERVQDGYRLGQFLGSHLALPDDEETERVQVALTPFLTSLYENTRQTALLGRYHGGGMLILNKLHGLRRVPSPSRIGGKMPMHSTSLGKAWLAFDAEAADDICLGPLDTLTAQTITDADELRVSLAAARRAGFARDDCETVERVASVASVVLDAAGRPVAALGITGPREEIVGRQYDRIVMQVCAYARQVYVTAAT